MLLRSLEIAKDEFESGTGWQLKPEGACKGDVCIPLSARAGDRIDVRALAADLGMPLVEHEGGGLWALGPAAPGNRALTSAEAPELTLPDVAGNAFRLSSLRGKKVLVYAWAPY